MKIAAIFVLSMALVNQAFAAQAFLQREEIRGNVKYCIYDFAGDEYIVTIPSHRLCPLSINV